MAWCVFGFVDSCNPNDLLSMFSSLSLYFCLGNSGQIKRYRCAQVYFFSLTKSSSSPAILTGLLARVRNQMTSLGKESAVLNSKAQGFKLIEMSSQGYKVVYSGLLVFHREDNKGHLFFSVFFLIETQTLTCPQGRAFWVILHILFISI